MSQYLLAYRGGGMAQTEEEQAASMAAWGAWFETLGSAIVDAGNPFGPSSSIASDGSTSEGGASGLTGYSIVTADNLDAATTQAKDCPILSDGGSVEVYEVVPVM
jgi:hypothetical protein